VSLESLLTLAVKFAIASASIVAAVCESDALMGGGRDGGATTASREKISHEICEAGN
jgi:hypothetical protein